MNLDELLASTEMHHPTAFCDPLIEYFGERPEECPDEIRDQIKKCLAFNLNNMGDLIEMVYARRDECGPIICQVAGKLAEFFDDRGYLAQRDRGGAINSVLRATAKLQGAKMPSKANMPEPVARFLPEEEVEETEPLADDEQPST